MDKKTKQKFYKEISEIIDSYNSYFRKVQEQIRYGHSVEKTFEILEKRGIYAPSALDFISLLERLRDNWEELISQTNE